MESKLARELRVHTTSRDLKLQQGQFEMISVRDIARNSGLEGDPLDGEVAAILRVPNRTVLPLLRSVPLLCSEKMLGQGSETLQSLLFLLTNREISEFQLEDAEWLPVVLDGIQSFEATAVLQQLRSHECKVSPADKLLVESRLPKNKPLRELERFRKEMEGKMIAFSSGLGQGRGPVSWEVAAALRCDRVSFGEFLGEKIKDLGRSPTREELQELGERMVLTNVEGLCEDVLGKKWNRNAKTTLIVDGVRHVPVLEKLKKLAGKGKVVLVHVSAPEDVCEQWYQGKVKASQALKILREHSTESDTTEKLPKVANIQFEAHAEPIGSLVESLMEL